MRTGRDNRIGEKGEKRGEERREDRD